MLRLKIMKNEILQTAEMTVEGVNAMEILTPWLNSSPVLAQYITFYGKMRRAARYTGIPVAGIPNNKRMQGAVYLIDRMTKTGMAMWLEYDEDMLDIRKSIGAMRGKNAGQNLSAETLVRRGDAIAEGHARRRERLAQMSAEERAEYERQRRANRKPYTKKVKN